MSLEIVDSSIEFEAGAELTSNSNRLQLSYNGLSHIAYEFTQCAALKYLNLRGNTFKEVPKAVSRTKDL